MLPEGFRFNQGNLQDYVDCPRRFQLRYVMDQVWPGVQAEPFLEHELHMARGARFHRLVERHQLGIDADLLYTSLEGHVEDADLLIWWKAYLTFDFLHKLRGQRYPELTLSTGVEVAGVGSVPLVATFDLVVANGERVVIFDWKTYRKCPSRQWFVSRLQTYVYFYVLVCAGERIFGKRLEPEQVSMVYWVVSAPDEPVVFEYNAACFVEGGDYLFELLGRFFGEDMFDGKMWPLAVDEKKCCFCVYRSLCDRGVFAGKEEGNMIENIAVGSLFLEDDEVRGF